MNLQRVSTGTAVRVGLSCCKCGGRFRDKELYADLDGVPFESFYCEPCAATARSASPTAWRYPAEDASTTPSSTSPPSSTSIT